MGNVTAATDFQLTGAMTGSGYTFTSSNTLELMDGSQLSSPTSTPLTVTSQQTMNITGSPSMTTVVLNVGTSGIEIYCDEAEEFSCGSLRQALAFAT